MDNKMFDMVEMKVLSEENIKVIHHASVSLLEEIGVKIHDKKTIQLLECAGAIVEKDEIVRIPLHLVERALRTVPKKVIMYDRKGEVSMVLEGKNMYFGGVVNCLNYLDPYTQKVVDFTSEHEIALVKLSDYLSNMSYVLCSGMLKDYDVRIADRIAFILALLNTTKPINFSTSDLESCTDIIELASAFVGGPEKLRKKPFVIHYAEPISPLAHAKESCHKLLICADAGVPVVYMPYSMMGGTAPMTPAGILTQLNAEILSGLVIHQTKREGAPFLMGSMPTAMDMKSTIGTFGAPEFALLVAAASEIAHSYGVPFYGTCGCTDAKTIDSQAVAEVTMSTMTSLLSKPNMVHDIGIMDHGNFLSAELITLNNELLSMLNVIKQGVQIDTDSLALDVIKKVGPGGQFLDQQHTFQHFKDIWYSDFMDRTIGENVPTCDEKITKKTKQIIENHQVESLPENQFRIVKEFEAKWLGSI